MRRGLLLVLLAAGCASAEAPAEPLFEGKPLAHWARQLHDLSPARAGEAGQAIWRFGPPAIPAVRRALDSEESNTRHAAAFALRLLAVRHADAPGVVPAVLYAMESEDAVLREHAVHALAHMDPSPPESAAVLQGLEADPSEPVRKAAAKALETLVAKSAKSN